MVYSVNALNLNQPIETDDSVNLEHIVTDAIDSGSSSDNSDNMVNYQSLQELLKDSTLTGVAQDSRLVKKGYAFVARRGDVFDGHRFIPQAIANGAVVIVGEASPEEQAEMDICLPYVQVPSDKVALGWLSAAVNDHPSNSLYTIGVTGTDGKTTTSYLLHHLLSGNYKTGLMSTASVRVGSDELDLVGHFTTPESPQVQGFLKNFVDADCSHAVIESSSHGFARNRLDGIEYDVGIWTNLTPEHLDDHGSFENYREAKLTLMRRSDLAIVNSDDENIVHFQAASPRTISYGIENKSNWQAKNIRAESAALRFDLTMTLAPNHFVREVVLPMIGSYNIYNALAAMAAAYQAGLDIDTILERLANFRGVPGRMQTVQAAPFALVVDFAHTAAALTKVLKEVRQLVKGRIITVIGAAGERDPGKRFPIGRAAMTYGDLAIFTEEDTRSEVTSEILDEVAAGAKDAGAVEGKDFWLVEDRSAAIEKAISLAGEGDFVLLAGKGHERTLERPNETIEWDEVAVALKHLKT